MDHSLIDTGQIKKINEGSCNYIRKEDKNEHSYIYIRKSRAHMLKNLEESGKNLEGESAEKNKHDLPEH